MARRADSDEHYVLDLCDEILGIRGRRQQRFDWLRGDPSPSRPRGTELPVDGYWPSLGLVVEFQEEQHSEAVEFFDRRQTVSGSAAPSNAAATTNASAPRSPHTGCSSSSSRSPTSR